MRIFQHLPTGLSLLLERRVFLEARRAPPVQPLGAYRSPRPGLLRPSKQQPSNADPRRDTTLLVELKARV